MPSGEEIQRALREFVGRWSDYAGSEKSEAQTFLNELFACYGTERREVGAEFEFYAGGVGFMDLHWPEVCLIEMKRPTVAVETAQQQVERYWRATSDRAAGRASARFIIICNFQAFEIWEYRTYPDAPVARFPLADLPDRYDALAFLAGPTIEPTFTEHYRELTRDAARVVARAFQSLAERSAAPPTELQRFVLQSVWCMFAEDLGMLDGYPFQATLNVIRDDPDRSAAELGLLFRVLDQKGDHNRTGRLEGTRYVNGELFARPAEVGLNRSEIDLMLEASAFDWRKVNPTIFGSLLEGVLGRERRWELGAHYTHEVDIMKIVGPTIVRPWRERMDAASTPSEARAVLDDLCGFRVLDPACGCGNFLYVAYRELRSLEWELKQRIRALAHETGLPEPEGPAPYYPLANLQGIDIENRAVQIARVTLWMGHRQMIERFGDAEPALPLQDLSGIFAGDALRVTWPETDCVIGNPPFLGAKFIRPSFGDDYADWLIREFESGSRTSVCTGSGGRTTTWRPGVVAVWSAPTRSARRVVAQRVWTTSSSTRASSRTQSPRNSGPGRRRSTSRLHEAWAWARSSTLETRLRYTSAAVFDTLAWPDQASEDQRERVAEASRRLLARRAEICTEERIGLTALYNAVDEGAWADLKQLHRELDEAVVDCYGWPRAAAQDDRELVCRLTELNREIAEGERPYAPFG